MTKLWIVGGGGAALEVWAVVHSLSDVQLEGFVTPDGTVEFDPEGCRCVTEDHFLADATSRSHPVVLALGSPTLRARIAESMAAHGFGFATVIHPTAVIGPRVSLGPGTVVMAGAVLETHVRVGAHGLINVLTSLAHECVLGDFCSVGPGVHLAGRVRIGDRCDLGAGCVARPKVVLGSGMVIGAGAVVVKDHPGPATLVGVPARPLARLLGVGHG